MVKRQMEEIQASHIITIDWHRKEVKQNIEATVVLGC